MSQIPQTTHFKWHPNFLKLKFAINQMLITSEPIRNSVAKFRCRRERLAWKRDEILATHGISAAGAPRHIRLLEKGYQASKLWLMLHYFRTRPLKGQLYTSIINCLFAFINTESTHANAPFLFRKAFKIFKFKLNSF